MIVEAFAESLDLGLAKYNQIVVRTCPILFRRFSFFPYSFYCLVSW